MKYQAIKPNPRRTHQTSLRRCALSTLVLAFAACGTTQGSVVTTSKDPVRTRPSAVVALSVEPATEAPFPAENPFAGARMFVDPQYQRKVEASREASPELANEMNLVKQQPTALWLDRIAAVDELPTWLAEAQAQSDAAGVPVVPVFVVYDLPNRDCAAKASNGELQIEEGGEARYREEYIDVIAQHFAEHPEQRVAVVLEPDSLPNLISNLGVEKCVVSQQVYINSIAYAIAQLSLPNVAIYLDAAHAGWLGWEANQRRMGKLVKQVLDMAGGVDRIRGFATNVANYNALSGDWGQRLESSNPSSNELTYVDMLSQTLTDVGIVDKAFLVDTSRNGQAEIRTRWGNWCNIRGAGLGERPAVAPRAGVDAYFWIKPPGDSDGTADPNAARFDENCASDDATPGAPEAGHWFHDYFVELVRNANPPL